MRKAPYPKTDWLMHNKMDLLTPDQRERYDAMVQLSDFLNQAMRDDMERTTGKYLPMLFTEFLEKLYRTVREQEGMNRALLIDDFIRIARFSLPAVKHIAAQPSTQIIKQMEKVPVSQVRQTSSATMRWMAKRPGRSVEEKIAPRNQVLTKVTRFSVDTKENREMMYLYGILHDVVQARMKDAACKCGVQARIFGEGDRELEELISRHSRIRQGALGDVPPVKQTLQNNKLMCDKYYKMIWDAVRQLSTVEEKLREDWERVEERYQQVGFWVILAWLLHCTDTAIYDQRGMLHDEGGTLWFGGGERKSQQRVVLFPLERPEEPWMLELRESVLTLTDWSGKTLVRQELALCSVKK